MGLRPVHEGRESTREGKRGRSGGEAGGCGCDEEGRQRLITERCAEAERDWLAWRAGRGAKRGREDDVEGKEWELEAQEESWWRNRMESPPCYR